MFISGPGLAIPLSGTGTAAGRLAANPASLAFGSVQDGGNLSLTDSAHEHGRSQCDDLAGHRYRRGIQYQWTDLSDDAQSRRQRDLQRGVCAAIGRQRKRWHHGEFQRPRPEFECLALRHRHGSGSAYPRFRSGELWQCDGGRRRRQTSSFTGSVLMTRRIRRHVSSFQFSLTGVSFPLTIAAGQTVPATLTFAPQSSGSASAVLTVTSNAGNTPTQSLSGVGQAATQHTVSLSWTDSGSGIAGCKRVSWRRFREGHTPRSIRHWSRRLRIAITRSYPDERFYFRDHGGQSERSGEW